MNDTTVGIDVSKVKLDICFLQSGECLKISNDITGFKLLLKHAKKYQIKQVIIEHTGSYQKEIVTFLQKQHFRVCVVNPGKVRAFAKAGGILAKTDKIDAFVLAQYGEMFQPEDFAETDEIILKLKELVNFRSQLVDSIKIFKTRLEKKPSAFIVKEINKVLKHLSEQEKSISQKIREFIAQHNDLSKKSEILLKINGVGENTVNVLLSYLPELGKTEKNKLSALCGLAPINHDSGKMHGIRTIHGGRKVVRNALYMAAVSACTHNPVIRQHYLALKQRGKPSKVALVACMRKLLIFANSLLKNL